MDGSTVWVSNGVYLVTDDIAVTKGVTVQSVNGYRTTTVQANNSQRCFYLGHADAVVDGFTLTQGGGNGALGVGGFGGAAYVDLAGTVQNCWLEANKCNYQGGGAYLKQGGLIRNCVMWGNSTATSSGGGAGLGFSLGGVAENCTIVANRSASTAGGVYFNGGGTVWNSIVWGNMLTDTTPDNYAGGSLFLYSCSSPAPSGNTNIGTDPTFEDEGNADFRLVAGDCIDAGTNMAWMSTGFDLDGGARIRNGAVDMGVYEFAPGPFACRFEVTPSEGIAPLQVVLTAQVSGSNVVGLAYNWDLDEAGTTQGGPVITNTFGPGRYTVGLTVSNAVDESAGWVVTNAVSVVGSTLYVATNGANLYPYADLTNAATSIQTAVDAAAEGCEVLVDAGLYNINNDIAVIKGITIRSLQGYRRTVVRANGSQRCFYISSDNAVLDGFTLSNGGGVGAAGFGIDGFGGALYIYQSGLAQNCWIEKSTVTYMASGAYLRQGGTLRNCVVFDNYQDYANAGSGGAVGGYQGGLIESCTIVSNRALRPVAGIVLTQGGQVLNSIAWYNTVSGVAANRSSGTITYTCTTPLASGAGNIDDEPELRWRSDRELKLMRTSPCRNAGLTQSWMATATDLAGAVRLVRDPDMGAIELPHSGTVLLLR